MRALKIGLTLLALAAGPAAADSKSPNLPDLIDVSEYRDHMVVVHSGTGHYIIAMPVSKHYTTLFYGDGKTFYQQRVFGGGLDSGNQSMSASFWSPRVDHVSRVEQVRGTWSVLCGKRQTELKALSKEEAKKLIDRAVFKKHPWKYAGYALSRDGRGVYYYVDRLRDEYGGKGFRLWVGPKGSMKNMQMTNIVSDSEGDIFATKTGELRLILSKKDAAWVQKKKKKDLVTVPVERNLQLIYSELGVYLGDLGTPCDHY
jgi:hypothetical protein